MAAARIYNLIRAVTDPYPGAFCSLADGSRLMIWWGTPEEGRGGGRQNLPDASKSKGTGFWSGRDGGDFSC